MINYSIIIPHYNIPELLMRCLKSIPIREDIQVIVVDDCSPDFDCYKQKYIELSRPYVELYQTPVSGSAGRARNIGIEHAKGKWIVFADADDLLASNAFSTFDKYLDSEFDSILFDSKSVQSDNLSISSNRSPRTQKIKDYLHGKNESARYSPAQPWGRMIKRSLIEENNIRFAEVRWSNDLYFSICTSTLAKNFHVDDSIVYIVTEREGSIANTLSNNSVKPTLDECKIRFDQALKTYMFLYSHVNNPYDGKLRFYFRFYRRHYPFMLLADLISQPTKYMQIYGLILKWMKYSILSKIK